jgi:hypothetical protein
MSLVVLAVVELDNVRHNNELEQLSENISTEVTPESLHNPEKLGYFKK